MSYYLGYVKDLCVGAEDWAITQVCEELDKRDARIDKLEEEKAKLVEALPEQFCRRSSYTEGGEVKLPTDERVFVVEGYHGFRAQRVCVVADVTDEEILAACNKENPQLVTGGWHSVIRSKQDCERLGVDEAGVPGPCVECKGRIHMLAICM